MTSGNGGLAFPRPASIFAPGLAVQNYERAQDGVSQRAYLAGQAISGCLAILAAVAAEEGAELSAVNVAELAARMSVEVADAMLAKLDESPPERPVTET